MLDAEAAENAAEAVRDAAAAAYIAVVAAKEVGCKGVAHQMTKALAVMVDAARAAEAAARAAKAQVKCDDPQAQPFALAAKEAEVHVAAATETVLGYWKECGA